jgi:hypothetical protein
MKVQNFEFLIILAKIKIREEVFLVPHVEDIKVKVRGRAHQGQTARKVPVRHSE